MRSIRYTLGRVPILFAVAAAGAALWVCAETLDGLAIVWAVVIVPAAFVFGDVVARRVFGGR